LKIDKDDILDFLNKTYKLFWRLKKRIYFEETRIKKMEISFMDWIF
jgi:hypothetical protein